MVKEGHDSTIRPKVQTYEFNNGRLFLDAWAADGKPLLSQAFLGRVRVLNVAMCTMAGICIVFGDWGEREHAFTPVRHAALAWWDTFVRMDSADLAKARSLQRWRNAPPDRT